MMSCNIPTAKKGNAGKRPLSPTERARSPLALSALDAQHLHKTSKTADQRAMVRGNKSVSAIDTMEARSAAPIQAFSGANTLGALPPAPQRRMPASDLPQASVDNIDDRLPHATVDEQEPPRDYTPWWQLLDNFQRGNEACKNGKWRIAEGFWSLSRDKAHAPSLEQRINRAENVEERARLQYHTAVLRMANMPDGVESACHWAAYRLRACDKLMQEFYPASFALGAAEALLGHEQEAKRALRQGFIRLATITHSLDDAKLTRWERAPVSRLLEEATDSRLYNNWGLGFAARCKVLLDEAETQGRDGKAKQTTLSKALIEVAGPALKQARLHKVAPALAELLQARYETACHAHGLQPIETRKLSPRLTHLTLTTYRPCRGDDRFALPSPASSTLRS